MVNNERATLLCAMTYGFTLAILSGCSGGGGNGTNNVPGPTGGAPVINGIHSSVLADQDNTYPTGRVVRIDVDVPDLTKVASGTIRITSASQGYDSGVQSLKFGSIYYEWDTTGLIPASDYTVAIVIVDTSGNTSTDKSLVISLAPNPPLINKLVSDIDITVPAQGFPVNVVRSYLLNSTFNGPMGYGWTHTYRMSIVEPPAFLDALKTTPIPATVQVFNADGTGSYFQPNGDGTYKAPKGDFRTLTKAKDGTYLLVGKYGTRFLFDSAGKLKLIVDRNGNFQALAYNANNLLSTLSDASGQTTTFTYGADNRISAITDPAGRTASYQYDSAGNLVAVTNPGGFATTYAYDSSHNPTSVTDPAGKQTFFTADANDRLATVSGAGGANKMTLEYAVPAADKMTITDSLGNKTVLTYDNFANVTHAVDSMRNSTSFTYDGDLNLTRVTDPKGRQTLLTYDSRGNRLSNTDAAGHTVSFTYEPQFNRMTSLTDANGHVTGFQYDTAGNLAAQIYPNGAKESYGYDAKGQLTSKTDRKNQTIHYAYNARGLLTKKTFPDSTAHAFTYDSRGDLTGATDANGAIVFSYDGADRLTKVLYPGGDAVSYNYDAANNRTKITYPDGTTLNYAYDALNRLVSISSAAGQVVASYTYDNAGRVVQRNLQNGTYTTYSYDQANRLTDLINRKSTADIISRFGYSYDPLGNRTSMTTLAGTTQYTYDALDQLTKVVNPDSSSTRYDFDPAGNRTAVIGNQTTNYSANILNQYLTVGPDSYSYDANGNLTKKSTSVGDTTYTYDFENHLVQVITPTETVRYTYDPFGRRTAKRTSVGTTKFVHDGLRVIMEKDDAGAFVAIYVHGLGIDEVLVMKRGGQNYYYAQDGLDSVVNLTDATQVITESISYDAYGVPSHLSTVGNPYLFTGREYEAELALYFYRARFYDPFTGRFLSADPIGISGGDSNFYRYVSNRPTTFVDPTGLAWVGTTKWYKLPAHRHIFFDKPVTIGGQTFNDIGFAPASNPFGGPGGHITGENSKYYNQILSGLDDDLLAKAVEDINFDKNYCMFKYDCTHWEEQVYKRYKELAGDGGSDPRTGDNDNSAFCSLFPLTCQELCTAGQTQFCNGGNPSCETSNTCAGDPTFIQIAVGNNPANSRGILSKLKLPSNELTAKITAPGDGALVRATVPIFGLGFGDDFNEYRLEYGAGDKPESWTTIATSTTPQLKDVTGADLDDTADTTIHGNLADWDTGLRNYIYPPLYPKDHPIDLKGTYTLRFVVTGKDGKTAEDRVSVTVADVIPNAWGGEVISTDKRLTLVVPEQAIHDSFRLIAAQPVEKSPVALPADRKMIGSVYELREPDERFTKDATLAMQLSEADITGLTPDSVGIYAYNDKTKAWEHLNSRRPDGRFEVETTIRTLSPYYALMVSAKPGEGSVAVSARAPSAAMQKVAATSAGAGPYLIKEDFEQGPAGWSKRDSDVGATLTLDKTATFDGSQALKIMDTDGGGNFAINVGVAAFDARDYPLVQFDYRIAAGVKTNFLVKVAGRWYDIGFTDDAKELENKRVNIAHIGDIAGVIADGQWHTAQFNLYDMLRTKTGNTQVETMIMADWDVPGYMKLTFGHNAKGASYYIDNFSVAQERAAGLRLDDDSVLVDNFNQKKATNALGGVTSVFTDGQHGHLKVDYAAADADGKGSALALNYDVTADSSYAGYATALPPLDLRGYQLLTFALRDLSADEDMTLGLKDGTGREHKVSIRRYVQSAPVEGWQHVSIPLAAYTDPLDWSAIASVSFSFEHGHNTKGNMLLDDVAFQRYLLALPVQDFEGKDGLNLLRGKNWTFSRGAAAVNGVEAKDGGNGIYGIAYGGNIGDVFGYDSGLNFGGWTMQLGGIDCSRCGTLRFRIRGAEGSETPNIYLGDGNLRWPVELAKRVQVTKDWQELEIPLDAYAEYIDLTHLEELQVVFEWQKMSGTVYLDDLRFGVRPIEMLGRSAH